MASNYTENYGLCQWEETDQVLREEFNENNAKVDAALNAKAEQSRLEMLSDLVDSKANQDTVTNIQNALNQKTEIFIGSYVGTGERGSEHPNTLTFPFQPKMVLITAETTNSLALGTAMIYGQKYSAGLGVTSSSNHGLQLVLTWDETTLSWYTEASYEYYQLNQLNTTYYYMAIG